MHKACSMGNRKKQRMQREEKQRTISTSQKGFVFQRSRLGRVRQGFFFGSPHKRHKDGLSTFFFLRLELHGR